ncbi:MAG TPA: RagB/SusD family nutrient uptake outer membrane protein [Niabella sp.]|nr:RagB/SusD family nutrient uptake outer membrane protein [Niabella sp.]HQW15868.1 RagB/SusD family nutrient uptake outer membrane protein [Niabella sp.]HQX21080.1 RagB/SusD family nutrient uptake outer membrane protein [Niabella sp.]HQX40901.1 RagB/SusD family nutrient uptake outer membrane protein [Niabella sp.]HRB36909.1 RagB/SusD family nutrient uptake outer membrane protein [Niabella sp.]
MKINFNKYSLIAVAAFGGAVLTGGCTKMLDQNTKTTITDPVFWKTTSDLISGTNYLYASLPGFDQPMEDLYSDFSVDIFGSSFNTISDGSRNVPSGDGNWNGAYAYIRAANNVMEKANDIADDPMKTYCIAQARFFRAFAYWRLVRTYGDVPYIGKTISGREDEALYTPRTDRRAVVDSIYADLDFAAANCPQADQIPGSTSTAGQNGREYGRITRSAALALKSRVALYEGSWHKYHGEPELKGAKDPVKHFTIARDAAATIMTEGKHSLFTGSGELSFQDLFRYPGETYAKNKENILAKLFGKDIQNIVVSNGGYMRPNLTDGRNAATRAFVNLALFADGLPSGKSPLDSTGLETGLLTDYQNRDPRMVQTLFKVGDPYASISGASPAYGNTYYYHQQKYWTGQADFLVSPNIFLDFIAIRYAEVLLNYAEAVYELSGSISDADLDKTINLLRKRATNNNNSKLALLSNAFVSANGLNMRDEIRRERSIELAYEGFRYWDLLRWKTAEVELPKPLLERKYFTGVNYGGSTKPPMLNGYVLLQAADKRKFDAQKDYLWPLPSGQIGLSNGTLTQNPGWK